MRTTSRPLFVLAFVAAFAAVCHPSLATTIEAVKGKHYKLTKRNGPWLILVASFNKPPEDRRTDGMTPEQAAEQLVYELRLKGIPAYTFRQDDVEEKVTTVNRRTQQEREGKVLNWHGGICVLAGNYPSSGDKVAQKTLKYIKKFRPQFLQEVTAQGVVGAPDDIISRAKSGGIFRTTKEHPGPLSGAFLTTNPLLTPEDLALRMHDPLILKLNSGSEYSLLQNHGKYTVVVATFQGRYVAQLANETRKKELELNKSLLGEAADRAWELCTALRRAKSLGYPEEFEAYVYHDHYSSIVTVGAFDTRDDPRITEIQKTFGAKVAAVKADGSPTLGAEVFAVPKDGAGKPSTKTWIFDPFPQVIDVPR